MILSLMSAALLVACGDDPASPPQAQPVFGWRSAGLMLPDASDSGGIRSLLAIGNTLFAMDAHGNPDWSIPKSRQWRMWKGQVGSDKWVQLKLPNGDVPGEWGIVAGRLVVGTSDAANVYAYDIANGTWMSFIIRSADIAGGDTTPTVSAVGEYQRKVVVSIKVNKSAEHRCFMQNGSDTLSRIPCMRANRKMPFYAGAEYKGAFYAYHSEWGVHRYHLGDSTWDSLPSPRSKTDPTEWEFLSALNLVDGKIYVGYERWSDGVFRWDDDHWTSMTPKDSLGRRETSETVKIIAGHRGRLFQGGMGGSAIAMLTPRDSGKVVWGDWRFVDSGWYRIDGIPEQTRGIVGIGDTLYAAGWSFVAKVPFADLDKMARPMYKK